MTDDIPKTKQDFTDLRLKPAAQGADPDRVTLRIIQSGETTVTVDRGEYDEHLEYDGDLEYLLTTAPARLPLKTLAVGPDGSVHDTGPDPDETGAIHRHFGLSYSTHLVMPRTLLQSMPAEWQNAFVHLLDQYEAAFQKVKQPPGYQVESAEQHLVNEMTDSQLYAAGIEVEGDDDSGPTAETRYHRPADGSEVDPGEYVMLPVSDPLPHYNRGRTRITPRLAGDR